MARAPLTEWESVAIATDQRDAAGLGATQSFTIEADGDWHYQETFRGPDFGTVLIQDGTLKPAELKVLDKLVDIINREPIPDETTQVSHRVPEDTHTLVLQNPGETSTLYENLDERSPDPGTYFAFDNRADIAETVALNLAVAFLGEKYGGGDFLV